MRADYHTLFNAKIKGPHRCDILTARMDSPGPRAYVYYFGSYDVIPFTENGSCCEDLQGFRQTIIWHGIHLSRSIPPSYLSHPRKLLADQQHHWPRGIGNIYTSINIILIFGRRFQYQNLDDIFRQKYIQTIVQRAKEIGYLWRFEMDLISYDRLLDYGKHNF